MFQSARFFLSLMLLIYLFFFSCSEPGEEEKLQTGRPNIIFAISDDQSYPYASIYGDRSLSTPAFDAVARQGVLFHNVFCAAPQCSPNRAAILTGKSIWRLEEAGTHASYFPSKFAVFTDALEESGYQLGYTGKAWGPGNWKDAGRTRNPVGPEFNDIHFDSVPLSGLSKNNYAANFQAFLDQRVTDKPFFFWYGAHEPHRVYQEGGGLQVGKIRDEAVVPPFLPDVPEIREDILDYVSEIEWFDRHLGQMMTKLEELGELDNTVIIITSDNGMAFPYAKANLQEFGVHVPMAICGPGFRSGVEVQELISHVDLAPTILEIAKIEEMKEISGVSFLPLLQKFPVEYQPRDWIVTGRERHTHARPDNLGYPARAIRTQNYLYIHNFRPDLWPAGDPEITEFVEGENGSEREETRPGYFDIDASPSKTYLLEHQSEFPREFRLGFAKRPAEELFNISEDAGCLVNLASNNSYVDIKNELKSKLEEILMHEQDPRIIGEGDIFDSYPRMSPMRNFPGFKERGAYNPAFEKQENDE